VTQNMARSAARPQSIVIAVLAYQRADELKALLPDLVRQAESSQFQARVLVIDNDPVASAAAVVDRFAHPDVHYVHEPRPGIAAARNRALEEAAADDILVFIDDDERPVAGWLDSMVDMQQSCGSAGVVGPVVSEFGAQPSDWIRAGRFFERRRFASGTEVDVAATNNLLLDLRQIRTLGVRFDERFGLSGGSDTLFTREVARRGGRLVWCDEALVIDRVPPGRVTRQWVLRRSLRSGNSWSRTALEIAAPGRRLSTRAALAGRSVARIGGGAGQFLIGLLCRSSTHHARGLRTLARGIGMFAGSFGYVYSEYGRPTEPLHQTAA
jgi:succinoglycan biosynthesis protein ExoM